MVRDSRPTKETVMELFAELFSDWVGILSFGVIAFIVVIAIFFLVFFMRQSGDPRA
jgi:hypothetical protein